MPSPPLKLAPGSHGARSIGVAQRLVPIAVSTATQYSNRLPVPSVLEIIVKARPWLTAMEPNPFVSDPFVQATNPARLVAHVVAMASGEVPSVVGPRYCGQSVPRTAPCPRNIRTKAAPLRRLIGHHYNTPRASAAEE